MSCSPGFQCSSCILPVALIPEPPVNPEDDDAHHPPDEQLLWMTESSPDLPCLNWICPCTCHGHGFGEDQRCWLPTSGATPPAQQRCVWAVFSEFLFHCAPSMVKQCVHPKQNTPYALTWQAAGPGTKHWDGNDASWDFLLEAFQFSSTTGAGCCSLTPQKAELLAEIRFCGGWAVSEESCALYQAKAVLQAHFQPHMWMQDHTSHCCMLASGALEFKRKALLLLLKVSLTTDWQPLRINLFSV